jgi:hypothetical protein
MQIILCFEHAHTQLHAYVLTYLPCSCSASLSEAYDRYIAGPGHRFCAHCMLNSRELGRRHRVFLTLGCVPRAISLVSFIVLELATKTSTDHFLAPLRKTTLSTHRRLSAIERSQLCMI